MTFVSVVSYRWINGISLAQSFATLYQLNLINLMESNDFVDDQGSDYQKSKEKTLKKMMKNSQTCSWIVKNCPPSLKFLVKFCRWFGFSFTGVIFFDGRNDHFSDFPVTLSDRNSSSWRIVHSMSNGPRYQGWLETSTVSNQPSYDQAGQHLRLRLQRYFFFFYNFLIFLLLCSYLVLLITVNYFDRESQSVASIFVKNQNLNNNWNSFFTSITDIDQNHTDLNGLKPILRGIISSLLYVVFFDNFISVLYFMIRGGRLIHLLVKILNIELFDYSKQFAYRALGITFILSCFINMLGLILFNGQTAEFIDLKSDLWPKITLTLSLMRNVIMFFYLSVVPILFIYTMMLFKFAINQLLNEFATVNLDEIHMLKLKTKLSNLNDQFKEIIPYFALPLTINFAANIFIIISSACFLMIQSTRNQYKSLVFSLGLFSFLRLIVIACVGNLPTNICRDLIRTVYENLEQWNLNEWMCFMELKRLRKEFIVSIFSMYTVRQSSILAMLGFALNYIVILLQTENYGPSNSFINTTNETSPILSSNLNITKLILIGNKNGADEIFQSK